MVSIAVAMKHTRCNAGVKTTHTTATHTGCSQQRHRASGPSRSHLLRNGPPERSPADADARHALRAFRLPPVAVVARPEARITRAARAGRYAQYADLAIVGTASPP